VRISRKHFTKPTKSAPHETLPTTTRLCKPAYNIPTPTIQNDIVL